MNKTLDDFVRKVGGSSQNIFFLSSYTPKNQHFKFTYFCHSPKTTRITSLVIDKTDKISFKITCNPHKLVSFVCD